MIMLFVCWGAVVRLCQLMLGHLAIINEGSRALVQPRDIADVTLAQAFYGWLEAGEADYYRFTLSRETALRLSMLVPDNHYQAGFQPVVTIAAASDTSRAPLVLMPADYGTRDGTTFYRRTQQATPTLPANTYLVEVRSDVPGVYCFCVGTREPREYASDATRARVRQLLATPPLSSGR
jgi:hypothetical protein